MRHSSQQKTQTRDAEDEKRGHRRPGGFTPFLPYSTSSGWLRLARRAGSMHASSAIGTPTASAMATVAAETGTGSTARS